MSELAAAPPASSIRRGGTSTALQTVGLRHEFGRRQPRPWHPHPKPGHLAVGGVDLQVSTGECFGLLGPNGAGKTTTIRLMNTLLPIQSGRIEVFGHDVASDPMTVRSMLGYVPQQLSIESALTARQNVQWFARLYDVPRDIRRERVEEVLELVELTEDADRLASTFSGGMVRRLEIAQALVNHPALLILDEPTVGLDPVARQSVWSRLDALRRSYGMTIILTTHYMEEADELCDQVAIMNHGTVSTVGSPEELKAGLQQRDGEPATLEDVFRHYAGADLDNGRGMRDVRSTRNTARRLG